MNRRQFSVTVAAALAVRATMNPVATIATNLQPPGPVIDRKSGAITWVNDYGDPCKPFGRVGECRVWGRDLIPDD